jgi:hypothetical protein
LCRIVCHVSAAAASVPKQKRGIIPSLKNKAMKKLLYVFALAGLFGFASCDSPAEDRAEEMEDQAEDTADDMEDAAEDADTSAVI